MAARAQEETTPATLREAAIAELDRWERGKWGGGALSAITPKGVCKKCGRKIGRGIAMHERHCKGE